MFLQDLALTMCPNKTQHVTVGVNAWDNSTASYELKVLWEGVADEIPIKYAYNAVRYVTSDVTADGRSQLIVTIFE